MFEDDKAYLTAKFRGVELDPATGLDTDTIKALADGLAGQSHPVIKAPEEPQSASANLRLARELGRAQHERAGSLHRTRGFHCDLTSKPTP